MRGQVIFLVVLDTIRYVYRTGRVPKITAQVASRLSISRYYPVLMA